MENNDRERNEMSPAIKKQNISHYGNRFKMQQKNCRKRRNRYPYTHIYMTINVSGIVQVLRKKKKKKKKKIENKTKLKQKRKKYISQNNPFNNVIF